MAQLDTFAHDKEADGLQADETYRQEKGVYEVCETIGYAATVAWLPTLLLNGALSSGDAASLFARLPHPANMLGGILPAALCLLLCSLFGLAMMATANKLTTKKHFFRLCIFALCCTIASLCIRSDLAEVILLAAAFSIARLIWKMHVVNKAFDAKTLLGATLLCGASLVVSALFDEATSRLALYLLLVISLCMFLAIFSTTFKNWVFVPKEAMREKMTIAQKVFAATAKALTGVTFGTLTYLCSYHVSLVVAGLVWIASFAIALHSTHHEKWLSKSASRGYFALGATAMLALMATLPDIGRVAAAGALACFTIASAISNAIRHMIVEKDLTLSDAYLFGFRHATDSFSMLFGYLACYAVFLFAAPPSAVAFGFFSFLIVFTVFVSLLSLGVFESKRERIPTTSMTDPWHEKVMMLAKEKGLTPRQTEIFDALSRGRNAKYIMQRLYLSEGTVKKQVFQIYKRMDVHTQQDLITMVMEFDLK